MYAEKNQINCLKTQNNENMELTTTSLNILNCIDLKKIIYKIGQRGGVD